MKFYTCSQKQTDLSVANVTWYHLTYIQPMKVMLEVMNVKSSRLVALLSLRSSTLRTTSPQVKYPLLSSATPIHSWSSKICGCSFQKCQREQCLGEGRRNANSPAAARFEGMETQPDQLISIYDHNI